MVSTPKLRSRLDLATAARGRQSLSRSPSPLWPLHDLRISPWCSQLGHAYFCRTCWMCSKCPGMYSISSRSQTKIFSRSPRRERHTNKWPLCGFSPTIALTRSAGDRGPLRACSDTSLRHFAHAFLRCVMPHHCHEPRAFTRWGSFSAHSFSKWLKYSSQVSSRRAD